MSKTKTSKLKKELNGIIMGALRKRNMPYVNMEQACVDMARVLNLDIGGFAHLDARRIVASGIAGRIMPDVVAVKEVDKAQRRKQKLAQRASRKAGNPKKVYLPGIPSASTLERDIKEFYASWEWKRLSYDVKQERGRICECCGARPPKAVIHTDHIKPLRKYWHLRLERTNMQVLCEDCNMGKGSRDETDFRLLNARDGAPYEPELSADEEMRLEAVRDQLRLN